MAVHNTEDLALAAIVLNIGVLKLLSQKGLITDDDTAAAFNLAGETLGGNPRRNEVATILRELAATGQ